MASSSQQLVLTPVGLAPAGIILPAGGVSAVQQVPAVVGASEESGIRDTSVTKIFNSQGAYCFNVPAPPLFTSGPAVQNENDGKVLVSAVVPKIQDESVKNKVSGREIITVHAQLKDKVAQCVARSEIATNEKIDRECANVYSNLNRTIKETLSGAVNETLSGVIK